jgi:hypothetical protein
MTAKGHEEQFSPPTLSARYVIRQETFAGTYGNGRDAPLADTRERAVNPTRQDASATGIGALGGHPVAHAARKVDKISPHLVEGEA